VYQEYGFQTPRQQVAATASDAASIANEIGYPVALKIVSPHILHKTEIGGVRLNLTNEDEVFTASQEMMEAARQANPEARIDGVEVQEMVTGGTEIIIGLLDDPQFGQVILFGLGGVFVEVLKDVSFRTVPIRREDAVQMIHELRGYELLQGFRGAAPVSEEMLVTLLLQASKLAEDNAGKLQSVDFNPILVWEDQHRVLDAKMIWYDTPRTPTPVTPPNPANLGGFFKAESVAVIGASTTPGRVGHSVMDSLVNYDYKGQVYPVNPTRSAILGVETYPSLAEIPHQVDLVVASVALKLVPEIIEVCASRGIHNLVVVSGGGKELGGEAAEIEGEIRRLSRERGVRVVGPNCIGVFDGHTRLDTFFQVQERMQRPKAGSVAMVTQSGAVGIPFLEHAAELGFSKFVSYGNRADVDEADMLAYLKDDPETSMVAMYVEGFEQGRKFFNVAREVTRHKPVVVFKVGRTERAARAAMSHTGFFGGSYQVVVGALRQAGVIDVNSYDELVAVTKALSMLPTAKGPRVSMISNGAGTMVQGIDLLQDCGLEMPPLSAATLEALQQAYPPFYLVQNPIDVTGSGTSEDYEVGIEALLQDETIDIVMPWFVFQDTPLGEDIVERMGRLRRKYDKPILAGTLGGPYTARMSRAIEAQGVPVFQSVPDWIAAARSLALAGRRLGKNSD
jgi:3-hydroxypropionyl-CoA synthetase (ADP-forming)